MQLCSDVSAASGEDPIGSAWYATRYTMIELPLPWKYDMFEGKHIPSGLRDLVQELYGQGIYPPMVGFAPDEAWSVPGMTRVIDYQVPEAPFSGYHQREYLVPTTELADVLRDTLYGRENPKLDAFAVSEDASRRDVFVCTHGAIDACCAKYGYPLYKLLRHMADNPAHQMRVWRCTHFGGHRFAGTIFDMPDGRYWGRLEARDLGAFVRRDGDVETMRTKYRGWAALPYGAAQVAEGELFRLAGWDWFGCEVTPSATPPFDWEHPELPEQSVTFDVRHPERGIDGSVEVLVSPNGFIRTLGTTNGTDYMEAQQFTTTIISESGLSALLAANKGQE